MKSSPRHLPCPNARPSAIASAALLALAALSHLPLHAQTAAAIAASVQRYDIPPQSLDATLVRIGAESGTRISIVTGALQGLQAPAVRGALTAEAALRQALAGSGLMLTRTPAGVFSVRPAQPAAGPASVALGEVRVTAAAPLSAQTEGSNSYAAQAVTIGKSEQTLREIPQSISVITRQQMDDQGLLTVEEAMGRVTGVRTYGYENEQDFITRGYIASSQFDGVPQNSKTTQLDLAIYDRLEVMRGPAGLLAGSGEPGGAINYVRKRPRETYVFSGALSAGSWDLRRAEIDVTGPINADRTLRGRAVLASQDGNKFYREGHNATNTLYGSIEYDITPATTLGASITHAQRDTVNNFGLPLWSDGRLPDRRAFVGVGKDSRTEVNDIAMDLTHRFDSGWSARAALGRKKQQYRGYGGYAVDSVDIATGVAPFNLGSSIQSDSRWDTFDMNVNGPFSLFGRQHHLTLGYNHSRYESLSGSRYQFGLSGRDVFNHHDFGGLLDQPILSRSNDITTQSGLYTSGRFKLADPLTLVLGGRWSNYDRRSRTVAATTTDWQQGADRRRGEFTPYGGLVWDLTPEVSLYASYTEIFKPNTERDYTGKVLDPRVGWQTEVGAKGAFFDGKLNASLALFRIRDQNRAMQDNDPTHVCDTWDGLCSKASGVVQSQGWEAEVSGSPLRGLDLLAGYAYTDARYRSDSDAALVGQRFDPYKMPKHLLRTWAQYRFDDRWAALSGLSLGLGAQYHSDLYSDLVRQGGYTTVSAKIGYAIHRDWDVSLTINNLFDKTYLDATGYAFYYNIYGAPRSALLTLRGRF